MKKIFTITAALATTAVMVSSVFAETRPAMTAAYDATSGKVILTNAPTQSTTTYIVFAPSTPGEDGLETGTVAEGSIKQINQEENSVAEIYVGTLVAGKYQVRLGGKGSVYNALFTVTSVAPTPSTEPAPTPSTEPAPTPSTEPDPTPSIEPTPNVMIGSVDGNMSIRSKDLDLFVSHFDGDELTGKNLFAADTTTGGGGRVNSADLTELILYMDSGQTESKYGFVGTKVYYDGE